MPEGSETKIEINGIVYIVTTHYAKPEESETVIDKIVRLVQREEAS